MKNELLPIKAPRIEESNSAKNNLSWAACIPTLNRLDILQANIQCLLAQTCPPRQIIIVDASENVDQNRRILSSLFVDAEIEFIYETAAAKSSAVQRNQALANVTADIVVFIDDDSLLFSDCAESFLKQFEADPAARIAGISLQSVDELPVAVNSLMPSSQKQSGSVVSIEQKKGGAVQNRSILSQLEKWAVWRFFRREILMQAMNNMFVPYDHYRARASNHSLPESFAHLIKLRHLPGYGMAIRTNIAQQELFNAFLLAYCPCEDLDASYRYGRHGFCVLDVKARLNHFEVESSRITRMQATSLGISNVALFIHTNSDFPLRHRFVFAIFMLRRLLSEFLKDLLARRFDFPQTRGVFIAIPSSIGIFRRPLSDAQQWYLERQRAVLARKKAV